MSGEVRVLYKGKEIDSFPTEDVFSKYGFGADDNSLAPKIADNVISQLESIFGPLYVVDTAHCSYIKWADEDLRNMIAETNLDIEVCY